MDSQSQIEQKQARLIQLYQERLELAHNRNFELELEVRELYTDNVSLEKDVEELEDNVETLTKEKEEAEAELDQYEDREIMDWWERGALKNPEQQLAQMKMVPLDDPEIATVRSRNLLLEALQWEGYQDMVDYFNTYVLPVVTREKEMYEGEILYLKEQNEELQDIVLQGSD